MQTNACTVNVSGRLVVHIRAAPPRDHVRHTRSLRPARPIRVISSKAAKLSVKDQPRIGMWLGGWGYLAGHCTTKAISSSSCRTVASLSISGTYSSDLIVRKVSQYRLDSVLKC